MMILEKKAPEDHGVKWARQSSKGDSVEVLLREERGGNRPARAF